ncbi:MAG: KilA-N domain-containing protein [Candidatus Heimdallarchaeota archaeon]
MKTEVIMKRELFGLPISQKSKSDFFSATDLEKAGNKYRSINGLPQFKLQEYFRKPSTIEFVDELEKKFKIVKKATRGRYANTWVHPFLFIDIALDISPKLKLETYSWIYDNLIKYRNESGDSYKKMCGALYNSCSNKLYFRELIKDTATLIMVECGVNNWQEASEKQLKLRDRIQNNISLLTDVLKNHKKAISYGIMKAKESN